MLFPKLARAAPKLMPLIRGLEAEHMMGEGKVRELQHLLLAWELIGALHWATFVELPGCSVPGGGKCELIRVNPPATTHSEKL